MTGVCFAKVVASIGAHSIARLGEGEGYPKNAPMRSITQNIAMMPIA